MNELDPRPDFGHKLLADKLIEIVSKQAALHRDWAAEINMYEEDISEIEREDRERLRKYHEDISFALFSICDDMCFWLQKVGIDL